MNNLTVTEFKDIRVLTTHQLAEEYGADTKLVSRNFNRNKDRYQEGKHYIRLEGEELKNFKGRSLFDDNLKFAPYLYLWTEKGAFLHAKSLNTDRAWEVYEHLVDSYFRRREKMKPLTKKEEMKLYLEVLEEQEAKIQAVDKDLQEFKQDMPLLALECDRITTVVRSTGVRSLGGKESDAYRDKSLRGKVYSDIYNQLKREFGVSSYKAIKRSQADLAVSIVKSYKLPFALEDEIQDCNAQIRIGA